MAVSEINNEPVRVTGYDERRHPAVRQLARACIEIARQRMERQRTGKPVVVPADSPEQEAERG